MTSARRRPRSAPSRVREAPHGHTAELITYVESSALVAAILERDVAVRAVIDEPGTHTTSAITLAEAARSLVRAHAAGRIRAETLSNLGRDLTKWSAKYELIAVSESILARSGRPFPVEPIRTLDAIHLASIEALGAPPHAVTVVTRDERIAANARALGYKVS